MSGLLAFDTLVDALVDAGVPRDKAEERARVEHPQLVAMQIDQRRKAANVLEKQEQAVVMKMARAIGFHVYNLSQPRATKQTPGLPDLWMTHRAQKFAGWWETKRAIGGKLSTVQLEFADECITAGVPWGSGDRHAFAEFLTLHDFTPPAIPA